MELLYVVVAVAILLCVYVVFGRRTPTKKGDELPVASPAQALQPQRSEAAAPPGPEPPRKADEGAPVAARDDKARSDDREGSRTAGAPALAEPALAEPAPAAPVQAGAEQAPQRSLRPTHDLGALRRGLARSRSAEGFFGKLRNLLFGSREIPADLTARLEDVLLASDVGVQTTQVLLERVKATLAKGEGQDASRVWSALREEAERILEVDGTFGAFHLRSRPTVVLLVGVNGAGKTTTIGKLASKFKAEGHHCILAAGDTFRAAAVQQLTVWGERTGCEVVRGKDGADPSSVIFEAVKRGQQDGVSVVLADTAGRLHTKTNLMAEMQKIVKSAGRALEGAPHEILLVLDATNGQNALAQAREFKEALPLTGIVLTKLDGTAKGGVILGICDSLKLPVRFVGLGERPDDLHEFSPADFVEALLGGEANAG